MRKSKNIEGNDHRNLTLLECEQLFWLASRDIVFFSTYEEGLQTWTNGWAAVINVNDIFCYAADAEHLEPERAGEVIDAFKKWGYDGVIAWASIKRNGDPLKKFITPKFLEAKEELLKKIPPIEIYPACQDE